MHTYKVTVYREDRWWMIQVPELDGYTYPDGGINTSDLTQARRYSDITSQARDFISTVTDEPLSQIDLNVTVTVDGINVTDRAQKVVHARRDAEARATDAQCQARELARDLAKHGVTVRDIGELLGVSFQRAQQLISA